MAEFGNVSKNTSQNIGELDYCFNMLKDSIDLLEENKADVQTIIRFKNNIRSMKELLPETQAYIDQLETLQSTDKHGRIITTFQASLNKKKKEFERAQITIEKHLRKPEVQEVQE